MTQKTITETITKEIYIANDGRQFKNKNDAIRYEWEQSATSVYAIQKRGSYARADDMDIYSTRQLAEKTILSYPESIQDKYYILKVYLDEKQLST